jgi:hypothetical protein
MRRATRLAIVTVTRASSLNSDSLEPNAYWFSADEIRKARAKDEYSLVHQWDSDKFLVRMVQNILVASQVCRTRQMYTHFLTLAIGSHVQEAKQFKSDCNSIEDKDRKQKCEFAGGYSVRVQCPIAASACRCVAAGVEFERWTDTLTIWDENNNLQISSRDFR